MVKKHKLWTLSGNDIGIVAKTVSPLGQFSDTFNFNKETSVEKARNSKSHHISFFEHLHIRKISLSTFSHRLEFEIKRTLRNVASQLVVVVFMLLSGRSCFRSLLALCRYQMGKSMPYRLAFLITARHSFATSSVTRTAPFVHLLSTSTVSMVMFSFLVGILRILRRF